ncbi:MAG: hypothetical protein RhofKO_36430 [Rhodothermales bacterium]
MSVGRHSVLLWAVLVLLVPLTGFSQSRTLVVEQGQIFINGQKVNDPVLLKTLQANGFQQVRLAFDASGGTPVLTLGGEQYALLEDRLRKIPAPQQASRFGYQVRGATDAPLQQVTFFAQAPAFSRDGSEVVAPHVQQMQAQLHNLQAQAVALERYGLQRGDEQGKAMTQVAARMIYQVEEVQRVAETLPHAVVEEYFIDVRDTNIELYERMMQESDLDRYTQELALKLRRLPDGEESREYRKNLEETLAHIFDLKQRNRREEIARLQDELDAMRRRVEYRETKRAEIIQRRMEVLLRKNGER